MCKRLYRVLQKYADVVEVDEHYQDMFQLRRKERAGQVTASVLPPRGVPKYVQTQREHQSAGDGLHNELCVTIIVANIS